MPGRGCRGGCVRPRMTHPYTHCELTLAKILALLHDPPWKPLIITGTYAEKPLDAPVLVRSNLFGGGKRHEEIAAALADRVLSITSRICALTNEEVRNCVTKDRLGKLAIRADQLASGYDRIALSLMTRPEQLRRWLDEKGLMDLAHRTGLVSRYDKVYPRTAVVTGLFNIFDPATKAVGSIGNPYPPTAGQGCRRRGFNAIKDSLTEFLEELRRRASEITCSCWYGKPEDSLLMFYHVFSVLYEPLWHKLSRGLAWGPADTRVPHHSVFDHLYASAMAVNMVSKKREFLAGFLVYVGFRGLGEWLRGSRKLSDLWVSSWLATAMVWYAIKDIVWCIGPDALLIPGFRWNQFYLSTVRERLGEKAFEDALGDVAREFYYWEGFPYYAWEPAKAVLALPLIKTRDTAVASWCGFLNELYEEVTGELLPETLGRVARKIREYLEDRLREAWVRVAEAVRRVAKRKFCRDITRVFDEAAALTEHAPPMEPVVEVVPLMVKASRDKVEIVVGDRAVVESEGYEINARTCLKCSMVRIVEKLINGLDEGRSLCELKEAIEKSILNLYSLHGPSTESVIREILTKITYSLGYYYLMKKVNEKRVRPAIPGWARIHLNTGVAQYPAPSTGGARVWRSCSVCKRGVALLHVPGRDLPNGEVSDDYKDFAMKLCGPGADRESCWRMWRPVLRPGERLCPHCLIKRFAGLPEFFEAVAEELVGYRPGKEVRFPSTDDVAALATKLALLKLAEIVIVAEKAAGNAAEQGWVRALSGHLSDIKGLFRSLAEEVSTIPHRSEAHNELANHLRQQLDGGSGDVKKDVLEHFFRARWWTPRILYDAAKSLLNSVRDEGSGGGRLGPGAIAATALLAADVEFRDMLEARPKVRRILKELGKELRDTAKELGREHRGDKKLLNDIAEALEKPRLYYALIRFDVDRAGELLDGIMTESDGVVDPIDYLGIIICTHEEVLQEMIGRLSKKKAYGKALAARITLDYFADKIDEIREAGNDLLVAIARVAGTVLVTPSYHYAISNAISYTLLKAARKALNLGGLPVYMGGDEGLVVMPAWLPWSLLRSIKGPEYGRRAEETVLRASGLAEYPFAENPGLIYSIIARRMFWGADSPMPGFHTVWARGAGTVYAVPALVTTGLSIGMRYPHYRDHLYAELAATEHLVMSAKSEGGDTLVMSMGRLSPTSPRRAVEVSAAAKLAPVKKLSEVPPEKVAREAALPGVIAGLIRERKASAAMLRAHTLALPGGEDAIASITRAGDSAESIVKGLTWEIIERHVNKRWRHRLREAVTEAVTAGERPIDPWQRFLHLMLASKIVLESMERAG